MNFKLASATYVKYVHVTGDNYDNQATADDAVSWGPTGTCNNVSNGKFYMVQIYVGNSTVVDEARYCGLAGSDNYMQLANLENYDVVGGYD